MIKKINFTKMVASGNDFIIIENREQLPPNGGVPLRAARMENRSLTSISREICDRKYGAGADGVLLLEESKKAAVRMRIFNADGSEAEMCGNGARCAALYSARNQKTATAEWRGAVKGGKNRKHGKINIETKAGIIESVVEADNNVKIMLTDPKDIKTDILLKVNNRHIKVNFVNTGVPHTVIFVEGVEKIDVFNFGRAIRYHNKFKPAGTNVNFVELLNNDSIAIRTYERGVEDETLACGTGSVASVLLSSIFYPLSSMHKINVHTQSGEILKVYFNHCDNRFYNVWLEGGAKIVYKGEYYV